MIPIPKGYIQIKRGKIQSGDMIWNSNYHSFNSPLSWEIKHVNIEEYFCVIRKSQNSHSHPHTKIFT